MRPVLFGSGSILCAHFKALSQGKIFLHICHYFKASVIIFWATEVTKNKK